MDMAGTVAISDDETTIFKKTKQLFNDNQLP